MSFRPLLIVSCKMLSRFFFILSLLGFCAFLWHRHFRDPLIQSGSLFRSVKHLSPPIFINIKVPAYLDHLPLNNSSYQIEDQIKALKISKQDMQTACLELN